MKDVVIHQCLHGYSEGHRLLESSTKLPDEIARLMLRMSDLSGGSVFPGFEEYVTGYPLAPLNLYVFAKTWYAAEMPRPGCVWTHSLIIQTNDFAEIPTLERLTKFFVRPRLQNKESSSPKRSTSYANSLTFNPAVKENANTQLDPEILGNLRALIVDLYSSKKSNLLIPCPTSTAFESSIVKIWSQHWPKLRGSFSFCTGSLSSRGFAGRPFDLQCAPPQLIREITASARTKQAQEMSIFSPGDTKITEQWENDCFSDVLINDGTQFRNILWALADGQLISLFDGFARVSSELLSDNKITLQKLIALVAELFPNKSTGVLLKSKLFGEDRSEFPKLEFSELEMLTEFSTTEYFQAFDPTSLNLRTRAVHLCRSSDDDAKHLISKIFQEPINALGEDILAGLLEAINPDIARRITKQQPHFLPTLFRAKPELGKSAELWRAGRDRVRELFEALASINNLSKDDLSAISEAIIASGAESMVKRALETWGEAAVFGMLNYIVNSGVALTDRVVGDLTFHTQAVMAWLSAAERPLLAKTTCAHIVAPYSYQIKNFGTDIWLRTYQELRDQANVKETNYVATLLLALGLQNVSPIPEKVVELCFEHIHELTRLDKLPDMNWIIVDPIIPHLSWRHDWDKCERLRRGLVEAFVKYHWTPEHLADCIKSEELLCWIMKSAKHVEGGASYFVWKN